MLSRSELADLSDYLNGDRETPPDRSENELFNAVVRLKEHFCTEEGWELDYLWPSYNCLCSHPLSIDFGLDLITVSCDLGSNETLEITIHYRGQTDRELIDSLKRLYRSASFNDALDLLINGKED